MVKKPSVQPFWAEYVCSHISMGDESSHNFRSSRCSPRLISEIIFMNAREYPLISAAIFHLWMVPGKWTGVRYQSCHVNTTNYKKKNVKTIWKILCHKNVAEINLTLAVMPAERLVRSGIAIHECIYTAFRFQQVHLCPKQFAHLLTPIDIRSHPW